MTDAVEMGPLDDSMPYLFAVEKWAYVPSKSSGELSLDVSAVVVRPEGINQKIFETINLINANTKSRAINLLVALGYGSKEEIKENKKFMMPPAEDVLGQQFGATVRTQVSKDPRYGDKSVFRKLFNEDEYFEMVDKAAAV